MKKLFFAFTLIMSFSSFARPAFDPNSEEFDQYMEMSIHEASLRADLATCDSEKALKSLFKTQSIDNTIGCEEVIGRAQTHMDIEQIEEVLIDYVEELKIIQIFQTKFRASKMPEDLRPDILILMEHMIDEVQLDNLSDFTDEEMFFVRIAYSLVRTPTQRMINDIN